MAYTYDDSKITESATEFSKQLRELSKYVEDGVEEIIKKSTFDLFEMIVARTPVDTGAAASNWKIGITDTSEADYQNTNPVGNLQRQRQLFFTQKITNIIWIVNNLSYISVLEEGRGVRDGKMRGSTQAPQGIVGISLVEFNEFLKAAIATKKGFEFS